MAVAYEWIVELVGSDDDIIETDGHNSAAGALDYMRRVPADEGCRYDWGVTRNQGDDCQGLTDRQWAYVDNDALPATFDGGATIPARLRAELAKAIRGQK